MYWGYVLKKLFITCAICALLIAPAIYAQNDDTVSFHNFSWGTSLQDFKAKMGEPVHVETNNGLQSIIYDNIIVSGFPVFLLAYFSQNGLEGGTYYFHTFSMEELMRCYSQIQGELLEQFGPTKLFDGIIREMRPYESSWNLPGGYVYLKVNTRQNEPVMLWYSSPALTKRLFGS